MTITYTSSGHPETCWRCNQLGLPSENIAPNEPHMLIKSGGAVERCCADCFERLREEIKTAE